MNPPVFAQAGRPFPDWDWVGANMGRIGDLLVEHLDLTVLTVVIGLLIAAPLAVAATRWRSRYTPLLLLTGVLFTIPSQALFVLGRTTSLIGLVIYSLLILFRNTVAGLDSVPAEAKETALAMGFTPPRLLWRVELPLALPVIIAGVRITTVTTIGLVTVTAQRPGGLAETKLRN